MILKSIQPGKGKVAAVLVEEGVESPVSSSLLLCSVVIMIIMMVMIMMVVMIR